MDLSFLRKGWAEFYHKVGFIFMILILKIGAYIFFSGYTNMVELWITFGTVEFLIFLWKE